MFEDMKAKMATMDDNIAKLRLKAPVSTSLVQAAAMDVAALYERFATGVETYRSLKSFFDYHNYDRPHQGLGNQTPWEVYSPLGRQRPVAAISRGAACGPNNGVHFRTIALHSYW
jgi:transposase InsO family protein